MRRTLFGNALYARNIVFGVEDSLVSTVGLLAGIATSNATHAAILGVGFIYICVEAFSMAVGSFLSEESAQEANGGKASFARAAEGAVVMFVSFALAGFVPVLPYLVATGTTALVLSITLSLAVLLVLGYVPARGGTRSRLAHGLRMAGLGGVAILVGVAIGSFVVLS